MFEHIHFNSFAERDTKIPKNAKKVKTPPSEWLSECFWDPAKRRLLLDTSVVPERASGAAYRIEDNGGMPFVCYVRDDAVSVFRMPKDGYLVDEDCPDSFETMRLLYTEEVITFANVVRTWIGIDESGNKQHGNSILVHVPPATKGRCVTAIVNLEGDDFHVSCTDLAGDQVMSIRLPLDDKISTLVNKIKDCFRCLCVNCFDDNGEEVSHDQPLKMYSRLILKDGIQSYVYIGDVVYSFDSVEVVTSYYSMMGNSSVPYPVAVTPTTVMFMIDQVQVPRKQLAPLVIKDGKEDWGDSYGAFYENGKELAKTPLSNIMVLCPKI